MLAGIYPHEIPIDNAATVEAWTRYLGEIPGDTLLEIVDGWNRGERHAPKPADILDRHAALSGKDGESAWKRVLRIVSTGAFRDRTVMGAPVRASGFTDDPAMEDAVKSAGGWAEIARCDEKDLVFRKKDFLAAYAKQSATHASLAALNLTGGFQELTDGRQ